MYQRSLLRLLLTPSITSGLSTFVIAFVVLGYTGWLYINDNLIFYDSLFGAYGLKTFVWQNSLGFSIWTQAFMSSPVAYYLLVGMVAVIVGLVVFTILQTAGLFLRGTSELLDEAHYNGPTHRAAMRELLSRLMVRTTGLIGWAAYSAFFVSSFLPFCIVLNQMGINGLRDGNTLSVLACVAAVALLLLALHMHMIFMRLAVLRPRIYAGDDAIQEIEAESRPRI